MLIIRDEQMKQFEAAALRSFEDEMVAHAKTFEPRLCQVIGDEQVRTAVRKAIERASGYRFTLRGPLRLFVEMIFLFGSHFDTDPQYPWAGNILGNPETGDEMARADGLYEKVLDYQRKVCGTENIYVERALKSLSNFLRREVEVSYDDLDSRLLSLMDFVFPQKAEYVGDEALTMLIDEGRAEALKYGFDTPRGEAMIPILMFEFGHGCMDDPLYPWISRTLQDEKITDAASRADRLERKSLLWMDHVLANSKGGRA